jgi:hypothetical protein
MCQTRYKYTAQVRNWTLNPILKKCLHFLVSQQSGSPSTIMPFGFINSFIATGEGFLIGVPVACPHSYIEWPS